MYSPSGEQANSLVARACFNCGAKSHDLRTCPVPRDEDKISRNREAHAATRKKSSPKGKGGKGGKGKAKKDGKKGSSGGKGKGKGKYQRARSPPAIQLKVNAGGVMN